MAHPSPAKAALFREIDLPALRASVDAASAAGVSHFVYMSVAQPAPVMKAYVSVRAECESAIIGSSMNATFLRPWYVLGPGHRWPYILLPAYWLLEHIPATRETAKRLGLITLDQMLTALVSAVESEPAGVRIMDVDMIRKAQVHPLPFSTVTSPSEQTATVNTQW